MFSAELTNVAKPHSRHRILQCPLASRAACVSLTDPIAAKNQEELDTILPEFKAAIRDHIRYLRAIAVETVPEAFGMDTKTAA
jgi:hypothetical protein